MPHDCRSITFPHVEERTCSPGKVQIAPFRVPNRRLVIRVDCQPTACKFARPEPQTGPQLAHALFTRKASNCFDRLRCWNGIAEIIDPVRSTSQSFFWTEKLKLPEVLVRHPGLLFFIFLGQPEAQCPEPPAT